MDLSLYLIASRAKFSDECFLNKIKDAIKGGVSVVQLREKALNSREFYLLALKVKALCDELNTALIINDKIDIALAINASGVHLGQEDLPVSVAKRLLGKDKIIGLSVKNEKQLVLSEGANYLGCGAVFESKTKDSLVIGIEGLKKLCSKSTVPIVAIGGINSTNMNLLKQCQIAGVAISNAIMNAENTFQASAKLKKAFNKARQ